MKTAITVRETGLESDSDKRRLVTLLEAYKADPMGGGSPYSDEEASRLISGLSDHPKAVILFCFSEGEFAGGAVCFETFATFTARPCINIHDICVLPAFRGMGLGRELMNGVIEKAKRIGAGKITLEVRKDNTAAKQLYASEGFGLTDPEMLFYTKML